MKTQWKAFSLLLIICLSLIACNSPYKKRKSCNGKGGWYGNRNL